MMLSKIKRLKPYDIIDIMENKGKLIYSQEGEDIIIERILGIKDAGYYIDVGAFEPKKFSNTYYFYKKGWEGINIEPNPDKFSLFNEQRKKDINLNIAISDSESELDYYRFKVSAYNTFVKQRYQEVMDKNRSEYLGKVKIKTYKLSKILDEYLPKDKHIDFLSIDTEGLEVDVLKSNDWSKYKPELIVIEIVSDSIHSIFETQAHEMLDQLGYIFSAKTFNTCFYLRRK